MNIAESESEQQANAKTSGFKEKGTKKITYSFIDAYHSLCLDKKDIISSELEVGESLLKRTVDKSDSEAIQSENNRTKNGIRFNAIVSEVNILAVTYDGISPFSQSIYIISSKKKKMKISLSSKGLE